MPATADCEIRRLCREARSILLRLAAIGREQRAARDASAALASIDGADLSGAHQQITRLSIERASLVSALARNHDRARSLALETT